MWSLRVYTRKKRAGQRLNLTPTPDLGPTAKAEAPPGPGRRHSAHRLKGKAHRLQKISEKAESSGQGVSGSRPPSARLRVTGQKSLQENSTNEEPPDEKIAPLSESVTDDLQVDCSSSNSELVSGLSVQHGISSSLLSYSFTDSYTEYKSFEESLSSFPSPELFRGSDYLDWECPKLEEHMRCKNSTLLDTSKAVSIEKVPQFSNVSAILGMPSEDYQKCHREIVMMLADQNISLKPKSTSHSESDNAACEVLLAEKTYPSAPGKTKKKPEKDPEPRDTNFQTKLSSRHLKIKVPSGRSITKIPLSQPLEPTLRTNSSIPDKKSRGLLTSTPSSQTAGLVIDLSSVQRASFEELFPNVSNYVNSNEIVPVSNLQENSSNEVPSNTSEICCIIRATPRTRQKKSKGVIVKKKKYSPPKDIPQDIIIKTNGRI
ncbi:meiosis-specific kinetochore protein isoform X1 [Zalophus californianus]|uniref:Meiosis-specific kinetochore protein isoform X1 n=1 Tax=Zalophus californianus TaxID=9704 RepID=A0A6J2DUG4_ZALCA|nr:meiosis-specific kinetochore protein isoform X1 [Zalophus californianus]